MIKRINHKKLHFQLEEMGYEVYKCDYSYGTHTYQIEKDQEWHEYKVENQNGEKVVNLYGIDSNLKELIKNYYNGQGIKASE